MKNLIIRAMLEDVKMRMQKVEEIMKEPLFSNTELARHLNAIFYFTKEAIRIDWEKGEENEDKY